MGSPALELQGGAPPDPPWTLLTSGPFLQRQAIRAPAVPRLYGGLAENDKKRDFEIFFETLPCAGNFAAEIWSGLLYLEGLPCSVPGLPWSIPGTLQGTGILEGCCQELTTLWVIPRDLEIFLHSLQVFDLFD